MAGRGRGSGSVGRAEGASCAEGKCPLLPCTPGTQKRRPGARLREAESFSAPPSLLRPPGPALPAAPPGPVRLGRVPERRGPMGRSGPAPSRADWPWRRRPRLISKFSGERRRDPAPASAPGNAALAVLLLEAVAAAPGSQAQLAGAGPLGRGGPRAPEDSPGRGPGRSQRPAALPARPKPMPGSWPVLRLERGPGSAWPRLLT